MAGHANGQAVKFAEAVESHPKAELEFPVQANEVFVKWRKDGFERLESQGIELGLWPGRDDLARFVFGHSSSDEEVGTLITALNGVDELI